LLWHTLLEYINRNPYFSEIPSILDQAFTKYSVLITMLNFSNSDKEPGHNQCPNMHRFNVNFHCYVKSVSSWALTIVKRSIISYQNTCNKSLVTRVLETPSSLSFVCEGQKSCAALTWIPGLFQLVTTVVSLGYVYLSQTYQGNPM
jgi:hypothetical protein